MIVASDATMGLMFRRGMRGGAIAAAAVAGALLGFGLRDGMAARPFNAMAALVLGNRARGVWVFDAAVSLTGIVVLLLACLAGGALLALVIGAFFPSSRGTKARLPAFAVALVTGALTLALVVTRAPDLVGPSPLGALSISQGAVLALLAAVGFASGMGLAR
ncbi:MAG TPA: hypothetical protein VHM30_19345 [Gemmatimonadaceae bacterium]|nr:hypothetical protein [Gemmatimonadaceae bacterium]